MPIVVEKAVDRATASCAVGKAARANRKWALRQGAAGLLTTTRILTHGHPGERLDAVGEDAFERCARRVLRRAGSAWAAASLCLLGASSAGADDPPLPVEVHGFVSQGFIKTTTNNYLANSERGSF